jgi:hypothetical protein
MVGFGNLHSQNLTDSLLVDFFNKTFSDYFENTTNWLNRNGDTSIRNFYVIKDSIPMPENIITDYKKFQLHLVDYQQAYPLIRKGQISSLHTTFVNQISADTVDILINHRYANYDFFRIQRWRGRIRVIFRTYQFAVSCRGTMGYVPDGRFIYDAELNEWKHINRRELEDERKEFLRIKFQTEN